ncbi:hypothetical protein CEQ90_07325 [Lewinellaceae bacterium SD302]|nr:hypothetical protein CEQ90_07325 [Lewinellaceae bacterium SD302]
MFRSTYPAKVLLFGEHTVLRGGRALAVPCPAFGLQWTLKRSAKPDARLKEFVWFLQKKRVGKFLQISLLKKDLEKGWRLMGNVPHGYGVGSSGVVCAAIWQRYGNDVARSLEPMELRHRLAEMESFYHGSSSGTDPLISYLDRPVILSDRGLDITELPADWARDFFLLDTRLPRKSAPLIDYFTRHFDEDLKWQQTIRTGWMQWADDCISALIEGDRPALCHSFAKLSEAQLAGVPKFIPPAVQPLWRGSHHRLKLCGAGGGGFMLGLTKDWPRTQLELKDWNLVPLFRTNKVAVLD